VRVATAAYTVVFPLAALVSVAGPGHAGEPTCQRTDVKLTVPFAIEKGRTELSGLVLLDAARQLIAVSNEGIGDDKRDFVLQVYRGDPSQGYTWTRDALLFHAGEGMCKDADFEGLARGDGLFFAITSHSRDRKKQDAKHTYEKNRKNLTVDGIDSCASRYQLKRFRLDEQGNPTDIKDASLKALLAGDPILAPFAALPSKENGIDIEGLAATEDDLFVGFRGPVLRQNYVPVLHLDHNLVPVAPPSPSILFVDLEGRGIRDLTAGPGGKDLYVLAGPNGNEDQSFAIYLWDGKDQIGGKDLTVRPPNKLCDLGHYPQSGNKPEGIAYIGPADGGERFLLVYDGDTLQAETVTLEPQN